MPDYTLDLCNRALGLAGSRSTIVSLAEASAEARNCAMYLPRSLASVLTRGRWSFADVTVVPTVVSAPAGVVPGQWKYVFAYPADCIRVRRLVAFNAAAPSVPIFGSALAALSTPGQSVPFALGNNGGQRVIYTNVQSAQLTYTSSTTDLSVWEPQAAAALEYALAAQLAIPLSGDKSLAQALAQKAEESMALAMVADANEAIDTQDVPTDWLDVRCDFLGNPYVSR